MSATERGAKGAFDKVKGVFGGKDDDSENSKDNDRSEKDHSEDNDGSDDDSEKTLFTRIRQDLDEATCQPLMDDEDLETKCDSECTGCFDDDDTSLCAEDCGGKCSDLLDCKIIFEPCFAECGNEENPLYCNLNCSGCADGEEPCADDCEA